MPWVSDDPCRMLPGGCASSSNPQVIGALAVSKTLWELTVILFHISPTYCLSGTNHTSQISFPPQQKGTSNSEVRCDDFQPFDVGGIWRVVVDFYSRTGGRDSASNSFASGGRNHGAGGLVWWGGRLVAGGWLGDGWLGGWVFHRWRFFFLKHVGVCWEVAQSIRGSFVTFVWCGIIQWFVMSF